RMCWRERIGSFDEIGPFPSISDQQSHCALHYARCVLPSRRGAAAIRKDRSNRLSRNGSVSVHHPPREGLSSGTSPPRLDRKSEPYNRAQVLGEPSRATSGPC